MADDVDEGLQSLDERRAHDRQRLIVDVFFDGQDVTGVASTKDISPGGLYMNTHANIPEGAFLMVRIPFSNDAQVVCNAVSLQSRSGRRPAFSRSDGRSAPCSSERFPKMRKPAAAPPPPRGKSCLTTRVSHCKENSRGFGARRRTRPRLIHGPSISNRRCCC